MNLAELAIRSRSVVWLLVAGALAGGWYAYENMPRFEDPEFTIRTALVVTRYPGATAEEVAAEVTEALETAIQELQEVDRITSTSAIGLSTISVEISYEFSRTRADLQVVWGKLRARVGDAVGILPPGAGTPVVNDAFGDVYGLYYLLTGEGFSAAELADYAKTLRTELLAVPDAGKVALLGEQREAIYVQVARDRAAALGVSLERVYADLAQHNAVVPAGDVRVGDRRLAILPTGAADSVAAIGDAVVSIDGASLVRLRDIATVSRDYVEPARHLIRFNGQPAIALGVANVTGANVARLGEAIDRRLAETEATRPVGIEVHEFYHQGKVVAAAVDGFLLNVALALVIVLLTVLAFMGARSAVVIGAMLLLTVAATLATMHAVGVPMHRISLGALIIALGMLVDNAIVVTDGILVGLGTGRDKLSIAKDVVNRSRWPLLAGTVVGILAFAPIGLAPGRTAEYTGDLFWVVLISLLWSWALAVTVVPLLCFLLFPAGQGTVSSEGREGTVLRLYRSLLRANRWLVIGVVAGLFALTLYGFQHVKDGFFPASTTPQLVIDYWLPEGTDIARTRDDLIALEGEVAELEGVEAVQTLIGAGGLRYTLLYSPQPSNAAYGQLLLNLDDYRRIDDLIPRIHRLLERRPDAQTKVWRFQLGPGAGSKIEAVFSGPDPVVLRRLASAAKAVMAADPRATGIKDDWREPVSVIAPHFAEARARQLGVSREDLADALRTTYSGRTVGVFRDGDTLLPIIARAPASERADVAGMDGVQIPNPSSGGMTPLASAIDTVETTWRSGRLKREDRVWTIKAQCDPLPGELPADLLSRLRPRIDTLELPPGYSLRWEGEAGDSDEANENLTQALPLGGLAMVLVVVALFNAWRQSLVVFLVVPLALIGVVAGLLLTGTALEFMALLGLLSLSGLLIKNAIVLVDRMDVEIREGKPRWTALLDAAASRVRPVMLGALTTVLGVLPLLGDAFFRSMAVVLVFGLGFATLLTLLVVPALYAAFFRIGTNES